MDAKCEVMRTLHVCMVTETYPPEVNGVAMTLQRLVTGLLVNGHRVSLVRPKQQPLDRPGCCDKPAVILVPGLPIPGYQGLHFGLPSRKRLLSIWRDVRPDVIYVATEGPLGRSVISAAEQLEIPVISGFHTNFQNYMRYYRLGFVRRKVLEYLRNFHNRSLATLVPNPAMQVELQQAGFRNVQVLTRGVDCSLFMPQRRQESIRCGWGAKQTDLVILYVGRLAAEKNIDLFIRSYRAMRKMNANVKAVVVGDGPLYKQLVRQNPDVVFCGMQRGRRLAALYASADMFLFPSLTETFGNVTLEAMASGLVVLAYDYAAARQHIRNGENGFTISCGDETGYINAARNLVADDKKLAMVRSRARIHVEAHDWSGIVRQFESVLYQCLVTRHENFT